VERLYLDANIYLDYWENRSDKMRPLGEFAFILFKRTFSSEFEILFSDWLAKELDKNDLTQKKLSSLMNKLERLNKISRIKTTPKDVMKARQISKKIGTHWEDCLHAVLAENGKAKYLVTRNLPDFKNLFFIKTILPEQL
jgi:predicted nucleic acid-binding protein